LKGKLGTAVSFICPKHYSMVGPLIEQLKLAKQVIPQNLLELKQRLEESKIQEQRSRSSHGRGKSQSRPSSNPYGDKFSQSSQSSHGGQSSYGGSSRNNLDFDTDSWIMKKNNNSNNSNNNNNKNSNSSGRREEGRSRIEFSKKNYDEDDMDSEDELPPKKSYRPSGNSSTVLPPTESKFATFEELMQKLKNTQKR
jgi:superfamily II DNA/RNA helicase